MSVLEIIQFPDFDYTVIEGTRYSNDLLRTFGQKGIGEGPFVILSREDENVVLKKIVQWPEPTKADLQDALDWALSEGALSNGDTLHDHGCGCCSAKIAPPLTLAAAINESVARVSAKRQPQ